MPLFVSRLNIRHPHPGERGDSRLQRMFKRVYNSYRRRGKSHTDAETLAAATVNQYRAKHGLTIDDIGRFRASHYWWPGHRPKRR